VLEIVGGFCREGKNSIRGNSEDGLWMVTRPPSREGCTFPLKQMVDGMPSSKPAGTRA
jgi:hypothetical protein